MRMDRRGFLKFSAGTGAVLASSAVPAYAKPRKELPPDAVGFLYDATICIGCQSCVANCKKYNSQPGGALYDGTEQPPYEYQRPEQIWDRPLDLTAKTLNIIKAYKSGSGVNRNTEQDGYSFVQRHCMHCVDPACVSACPVSALKKNERTGVVTYNKDACIGCRYCQVACPFEIPKFEWDKPLPQIRKCQMCNHRMEKGGYAACCEFCPTGASLFGPVKALREEAKRRLALKAGSLYDYPLQTIDSGSTIPTTVPSYIDHVYGLNEVGGTQFLMLSGVPFLKLGLPTLSGRADAAVSEGIQHTLYKGMIAPGAVLAGLVFAAYKNRSDRE